MEGNWDLYRYFLARRESLIGQALEKRALGEFLEDFHFDVDAKTTTMSPLLCACLSGDLQLVKTLLQQEGLNLHTPLKSMMQVGIIVLIVGLFSENPIHSQTDHSRLLHTRVIITLLRTCVLGYTRVAWWKAEIP